VQRWVRIDGADDKPDNEPASGRSTAAAGQLALIRLIPAIDHNLPFTIYLVLTKLPFLPFFTLFGRIR
jgi:hypothetical protein